MNKIYSPIKQKKYWYRFVSLFYPSVILIFLLSLISLNKFSINFSFTMTLGYSIVWGILALFLTRNYIKEIQINNSYIFIKGTTFNKEWRISYELNDISMEIKSQGSRSGRVEYFLKLDTPNSSYRINKFNEWKYSDLVEIYQALNHNKKVDIPLLNLLKSKI